jgi:PadR family transcriptional regulator, regulatory protein PadR
MSTLRSSPDFLNGVPELLILQLLNRKPRHGYELVQAIREATTNVLTFGEGCVYPILHRLEDAGDLTSHREEVAGRSRVVYRVTKRGKQKLATATTEWQTIAEAIHRVIKGGSHGRPELA